MYRFPIQVNLYPLERARSSAVPSFFSPSIARAILLMKVCGAIAKTVHDARAPLVLTHPIAVAYSFAHYFASRERIAGIGRKFPTLLR